MIEFIPLTYFVSGITGHPDMRTERRGHKNEDVWAIVDDGYCLNREGEWEYESLPSSRTADFIARTRYTLQEAQDFIVNKYGTITHS